MYSTVYTNGTRCQIQGEGDPNTLNGGSPVPLDPITCTYGTFINDVPNSSAGTYIWDGSSAWVLV